MIAPLKKRGFVTIATGKDDYYQLAWNLLRSYRQFAAGDIPFAILCDRMHPCVQDFDDVVIMDSPSCSYMDKLKLFRYSPYEETIFIDADALILRNPNVLWEDFQTGGDVSCYGRTLPLESKEGWYYYKEMGSYQNQLRYGISMHGGIYYIRNTEMCETVFQDAITIAQNFSHYRFAHFSTPADEPVLALSMGIHGCEPCPIPGRILFLISVEGRLRVSRSGALRIGRKPCEPVVLHFGTINTRRFLYRYLNAAIHGKAPFGSEYWKMRLRSLPLDIKIPLVRNVKRSVKYALPPKIRAKIQKIIHKP